MKCHVCNRTIIEGTEYYSMDPKCFCIQCYEGQTKTEETGSSLTYHEIRIQFEHKIAQVR